jgi:hypothetical protein
MSSHEIHEHHEHAATHHDHAAKHHREAAKHHKAGNHEKAAHHSKIAHGHALHAVEHHQHASKKHAEEHDWSRFFAFGPAKLFGRFFLGGFLASATGMGGDIGVPGISTIDAATSPVPRNRQSMIETPILFLIGFLIVCFVVWLIGRNA